MSVKIKQVSVSPVKFYLNNSYEFTFFHESRKKYKKDPQDIVQKVKVSIATMNERSIPTMISQPDLFYFIGIKLHRNEICLLIFHLVMVVILATF